MATLRVTAGEHPDYAFKKHLFGVFSFILRKCFFSLEIVRWICSFCSLCETRWDKIWQDETRRWYQIRWTFIDPWGKTGSLQQRITEMGEFWRAKSMNWKKMAVGEKKSPLKVTVALWSIVSSRMSGKRFLGWLFWHIYCCHFTFFIYLKATKFTVDCIYW